MQLITAALFFALVSVSSGTEAGKIAGVVHCEGTAEFVAVWAVRNDCRASYQNTESDHNRFQFASLPPGTYRLVGACGAAFALPAEEVRVEPGATVQVDLTMRLLSNGSGDFARAVAPLNGRIVDERGRPVSGVAVEGEGVQLWPESATVSDPDGRFGFCAVRAGPLRLTMQHAAYRSRSVKLSVGIFNYSKGQLEIKLRRR
jgi:FtsP/CotA-like multicopper oxidase with cupredoxin domain